MLENSYKKISALFPRPLVQWVNSLMVQGGYESVSARVYIGFALFFSLAFAALAFFITPFFTQNGAVEAIAPIGAFVLSLGCFYLLLLLSADSRAQQVESALPEVLQIISANIRAGMTLENAIWSSARPEFGALGGEIRRVSADTFGGSPISQTLSDMSLRVRSEILARSIRLIADGIKLGGEMSRLLEEVAADIRSVQLLRKEIETSTMMYVIFILFAAVLAAPMLYGISTFYSEMNAKVAAKTAASGGGEAQLQQASQQSGLGGLATIGLGAGQQSADSIGPADVYWFSIASLLLTNLFAALTLGLIQHGKASRGVKFIPVFVPLALGIYLLVLGGLRAAFGTFIR